MRNLGEDNTMSDAEEFEQAVKHLDASNEVKEKLKKKSKDLKARWQPRQNLVLSELILKQCLRCRGIKCEENIDINLRKKLG